MWVLRELVEIVLLLAQGLYRALGEARDFASLELSVERVRQEATRRLLVLALEAKDRWLMERRDPGLRLVDVRRRSLMTKVGEVAFVRRDYRDGAGRGRFLLDEALGLEARQRYSPELRELAVALAVELPFARAAQWLEQWTQGAVRISRMAIWQGVQAAGARAAAEAEQAREALFARGEAPQGARAAEELALEFDELFVRGRRDGQGCKLRIGLKHALAYEGKAEVRRGRAVLQGRRVQVAVGDGRAAVEQALADFARHWDFGRVKRCVVGGDGASWVRTALEYLPQAAYRLDPFHLRRALRAGLGHDGEVYPGVCAALAAGEGWSAVEGLLRVALRRAQGEQRVRVLWRSLQGQWAGIVAAPEARRLGAIEAENYHVLARRMKRRGAAWSVRGAHPMGRLRAAQANGELAQYASRCWRRRPVGCERTARPPVLREPVTDRALAEAGAWLQARLPALYGPHADRAWAQALKRLSHVQTPV